MANGTNLSEGASTPMQASGPSPSMISGLVAGLISFAVLPVFYVLVDEGMVSQPFLYATSGIFLVAFLGAIIYSIYKTHQKSGEDEIKIGRSIVAGIKASITISVVYGLLRYLFFLFLAPEVVDVYQADIAESMREQGITGSDLETGLKLNRQLMYGPLSIPVMILVYGFIGLIVSLITTFIMRALRS